MAIPEADNNGISGEVHFFNVPFFCSALAVLLSFLGIISLLSNRVHLSFSLILIAVFFDMIDGALSRKFQQESTFGALFDLLQDSMNYLLYPSIFFFTQGFQNWIAIIMLCIFILSGIFRLARFGTIGFSKDSGQLSYMGMPVYFNHIGVLIFLALLPYGHHIFFTYGWLPINSLLMVSRINFPKPKSTILWGSILVATSAVFLWL